LRRNRTGTIEASAAMNQPACIYADFNNIDPDGYVRLDCVGSVSDLARKAIALRDGLQLVIADSALEADVIVRQPGPEGCWRAAIIGDIRRLDGG
jgi:hypothetical protein